MITFNIETNQVKKQYEKLSHSEFAGLFQRV